jgi:predicted hydrocarbon binding protein
MTTGLDLVARGLARAALIAGSLASGRLFWVRASLGENQLRMHDCTADGEISIGGVSEQLYGEGFLGAWHEVLGRELGAELPRVLYEVGQRGGRWESARAVERGVWVPAVLRSLIGRPELLEKARRSAVTHAILAETLRIVLRMIMTEGGWGVVESIDLRGTPLKLVARNLPEPRRLGRTGVCSCHLSRGALAGYFETLFGTPVTVRETTCASRGDEVCTFELETA